MDSLHTELVLAQGAVTRCLRVVQGRRRRDRDRIVMRLHYRVDRLRMEYCITSYPLPQKSLEAFDA